jgi:LysM repeat protein
VKRISHIHVRFLMLLAAVMILVVACERPLQPDLDDAAPTTVPSVDPAPPQTEQPDGSETVPPPDPTASPPEEGEGNGEPEQPEQPPVEEPEQPPVEEPEPPTQPEQPPAEGGQVIHVVQSGDTLGRIAEQYEVTVDDIASVNGITNINVLAVGQELIIPIGGLPEPPPTTAETVHIVQAGDNLFRIGLRYGFTVDELADYNNLDDPSKLEIGQEIRIPPSN